VLAEGTREVWMRKLGVEGDYQDLVSSERGGLENLSKVANRFITRQKKSLSIDTKRDKGQVL
jgi:hypothetical protein